MRATVWDKTKGFCWYCGIKLRPSMATEEHVQPTSRKGSTHIDNVVPACLNCNAEKGDKNLEEYRLYLSIIGRGGPVFAAEQLGWLTLLLDASNYQFYFERQKL